MGSATTPETGAGWQLLIERMAQGDQLAMREFYDQSSSMVFALVLRIVRNHETAEDVALEIYSQVWRDAGTYNATRGAPRSWLLMLARSRAIDTLRSRRREDAVDPLDSVAELESQAPGPEATVAHVERGRLVRGAMAMLAPEQREVIELAFFGGFSHSEIAERLAQPLGTVKTRIRIGMMKLRDLLGHVGELALVRGEG